MKPSKSLLAKKSLQVLLLALTISTPSWASPLFKSDFCDNSGNKRNVSIDRSEIIVSESDSDSVNLKVVQEDSLPPSAASPLIATLAQFYSLNSLKSNSVTGLSYFELDAQDGNKVIEITGSKGITQLATFKSGLYLITFDNKEHGILLGNKWLGTDSECQLVYP